MTANDLLNRLLRRWELLFSPARHNQFLMLHAGILLIGMARPLGAGNDPEVKAKIRKQITESAWEMKNNVRESKLSALSRRYLLSEIERIVARETKELNR